MAIDLKALEQQYFWFDEPVIYKLKKGGEVKISPISLRQSTLFLSDIGLFMIDKNVSNSVEVIQMSYLEFYIMLMAQDDNNRIKFVNLMLMCLDFKHPIINKVDDRFVLQDIEQGVTITAKEFDEIKRIILYQNIVGYDDSYISPDLKEAMRQTDELKNKDFAELTIERKMSIVMAHNGMLKKDLQEMSFRSFTLLFNEVCGEVDFTTVRPISMFGGKEIDHWIFKKKKNRFEDYITSKDNLMSQMGGEGKFAGTTDTSRGDFLDNMFNKNK